MSAHSTPTSGAEVSSPTSTSMHGMIQFYITDSDHGRHVLAVEDDLLTTSAMHGTAALSGGGVEVTVQRFAMLVNQAEQTRAARLEGGGSPPPPVAAAVPTVRATLLHSVTHSAALFFVLAAELYRLSRDPYYNSKGGDVWTLAGHCPGFRLCCSVFREAYDRSVRPVSAELPDFARVTAEDLLRYRRAVRDTFQLGQEAPSLSGPSHSNMDAEWVKSHVRADPYFFNEQARASAGGGFGSGGGGGGKMSVMEMTLSYVPYRKRTDAPPAAPGAKAERENDTRTYYMTELLHTPQWEPDEDCTQCPHCESQLRSVSRPLGARSHHCRRCGHRFCADCVTRYAHRSFAKLSKPGSGSGGILPAELDLRLVCGPCFREYEDLGRHRYLGALFAFGGLDFADLSLCRTVNGQWRQAAELCITEYRLLLHQCEPDLTSVLTPVGVLLQNSIDLVAPSMSLTRRKTAGRTEHADPAGGAIDPSAPAPPGLTLLSIHPEPALLLLKFTEAAPSQWAHPATVKLLQLLAGCTPGHLGLGGRRGCSSGSSDGHELQAARSRDKAFGLPGAPKRFSHWYFYCTTFCSQMPPSHFALKAAEYISAAAAVASAFTASGVPLLASRAVAGLAANFLSPRALLPLQGSGGITAEGSAGTVAHTAALATAESTVLRLLDLLYRDGATSDARRRLFDPLLSAALPPLAAASTSLAIIVLCSLRSVYRFRCYDETLLLTWRGRVLDAVGGGASVPSPVASQSPTEAAVQHFARSTVEATMDFFAALDAFCGRPDIERSPAVLSRWLQAYCSPTQALAAAVAAASFADPTPNWSLAPPPPLQPQRVGGLPDVNSDPEASPLPQLQRQGRKGVFMDLPHPIYNPFSPETVFKSVMVTNVRAETHSSTKPVWLTFSTFSQEEQGGGGGAGAASATTTTTTPIPAEQLCDILYKRENAERDQVMCVSGRLVQAMLRRELGERVRLTDYNVLPISCDSAIIQKADGYVLHRLPGAGSNPDITAYLSTLGPDAKRNFLASAKIFLLLNYIFSIADRHPGNIMVSFDGAIFHIDFGYIFDEKTLVERLAPTTIRVDNSFRAAVVWSRRAIREQQLAAETAGKRSGSANPSGTGTSPPLAGFVDLGAVSAGGAAAGGGGIGGSSSTVASSGRQAAAEDDDFFSEAAEWFLALRPHAALFYELWLYPANRRTVAMSPERLATAINSLFDRSATRESSRENFVSTIRQSINVCRLKDATHYTGQVSRRVLESSYEAVCIVGRMVTESGYDAVRSLGSTLTQWANWKQ